MHILGQNCMSYQQDLSELTVSNKSNNPYIILNKIMSMLLSFVGRNFCTEKCQQVTNNSDGASVLKDTGADMLMWLRS